MSNRLTYPLRYYGDPVLKTTADPVPEEQFGTTRLRRQVERMLATMDESGGVGLAANQVGQLNRVLVFDTTRRSAGLRGALINPTLTLIGEEVVTEKEGCLSIPGISAPTPRYFKVRAQGKDVEGRNVVISASGLLARCLQHEIDHLDGILFLSRLVERDRKEALRQLNEQSQGS